MTSFNDISRDISRRFWNLPHKADEETLRENTFIDDAIQKTHIERLLLENFLADNRGISDNITFIHGSLEDLNAFQDNQFDLVMSFDAPISYTYPKHKDVIKELVRIANRKICISVYSRLAWTYHFDPALFQEAYRVKLL